MSTQKYLLSALASLESLAINDQTLTQDADPINPLPEGDIEPAAVIKPEAPIETPDAPKGVASTEDNGAEVPENTMGPDAGGPEEVGTEPAPLNEEALARELSSDGLDDIPEDIAAVESYLLSAIEQVENLVDATNDLNDVVEVAEVAEQNGGLDRTGAQMLEVATESFYRRIGVSSTGRSVPAIEQFGGAGRKQQATRIAVESVGGKVKEAFAKAGQAIKEIFARIMQFIDWVVSRVTDVTKNLDKTEAALKGLKTNLSIKVKNPGLAARLAVGTQLNQSLIANLDVVAKTQTAVQETAMQRATTSLPRMIEAFTKANAANLSATVLEELGDVRTLPGKKKSVNGTVTTVEGQTLPGNKQVFMSFNASAPTSIGMLNSLLGQMKAGVRSKDAAVGGEFATLTKEQALDLIGKAREILNNIKAAEAFKPKLKNIQGELEKAISATRNSSEGGEEDRAERGMAANVGMRAANLLSQPLIALNSYALALTRDIALLANLTVKANSAAPAKLADGKQQLGVNAAPRQLQNSAA